MTSIGAPEKKTQRRVVGMFVDKLHYDYFGDLSECDNHNIHEGHLEHFLFAYQGLDREGDEELIRRAVAEVVKLPNLG